MATNLLDESPTSALVSECLENVVEEKRNYRFSGSDSGYFGGANDLRGVAGFETLRALDPATKRDALLELARLANEFAECGGSLCKMHGCRFVSELTASLFSALMKTRADLSLRDLVGLLELYLQSRGVLSVYRWPLAATADKLFKMSVKTALDAELKARLQKVVDHPSWSNKRSEIHSDPLSADDRKILAKLSQAISGDAVADYKGLEGDAFGNRVAADLAQLSGDERSRWHALFHHCVAVSGSKPSATFTRKSDDLIAAIGVERFRTSLQDWLAVVAKSHVVQLPGRYGYNGLQLFHSRNEDLLKGFVWSLVRFHDAKTLQSLSDLAVACAQKIPGHGPVSQAMVNACIYTLANTKGLDGVAHLSRLKLRIRQNNTQKLIQKWIDQEAQKRGLKPAQIEDMAAPDFGLKDGERQWAFDDYTLKLTVAGPGDADLQWLKPDGKPQKSVPAFVEATKAHSDRLKSAKDILKQVRSSTTVQRDRIDRLYVDDMRWPYAEFQKYYLDHGLVSVIAHRLIWTLESRDATMSALFVDSAWQDVEGNRIEASSDTVVRLWHPIDSPTNEVLAWRDRLETLKLQQPMKQAHREVYLLTEAELNTVTYSNRMAAHILKQHQFSSLAALRGWRYSLLGAYDDGRDGEIARKELPAFGLRAEYWVDQLADGESFNDAGIWNYVATDQVRFVPIGEDQNPRQLVDVPKIVLSEIMRDCDMFVGVASVGNDPNWLDSGSAARQHRDYWQGYSFGDLSEVAKTRNAVLERLLPKLRIRDKTHIDGKFLIVDGKRHTYKIHIGSTNILIAPADKYLCIVPGRSVDKATDKLFIPFEGDRGLSILLSKAMMLADDDKITDPTILSQL